MEKDNGNWRKASYSNGSGNCVEVGNQAGRVAVRDTENRGGAVLSVSAEAWQAFTNKLK
jgi:putative sterol carrier protein